MYATRVITHPINLRKICRIPSYEDHAFLSDAQVHILYHREAQDILSNESLLCDWDTEPPAFYIELAQILANQTSHSRKHYIPVPDDFTACSSGCQAVVKCLDNIRTMLEQCQNNVKTMLEHGSNMVQTSSKHL